MPEKVKRITLGNVKYCHQERGRGSSLVAQWLGLPVFPAEDLNSIPDLGNKIPQATQHGQKKKKGRMYVGQ